MSELTKIKTIKSQNVIHIDQTNILDNRLSWKAKGIFTYLMSRPNDWQIRTKDLINKSNDGSSSLYSGLRELSKIGYIYRGIKRDEKKRIIDWKYYVFENTVSIEEAKKIIEEDNWILFYQYDKTYLLETYKLETYKLENTTHNNKYKDITNKNIINKEKEIFSKENIVSPSARNNSFQKSFLNKINRRSESTIKFMKDPTIYNEKPIIIIPKSQEIIDYWNALGLKNMNEKHNKKSLINASRSLGKLRRSSMFNDNIDFPQYKNRKFTEEEIKESIYNFHLAALNKEYEPDDKKGYKKKLRKTPLNSFIYNSYAPKEKSLFLKYFENLPKMIEYKNLKEEEIIDGDVFNKIMKCYKKDVLGNTVENINGADRLKIISASNQLIRFYDSKKDKLIPELVSSGKVNFAGAFWDCMLSVVENELDGNLSKLTPGWLCSSNTFERRFPAYLNEQAMLKSSKGGFSIYDTPKGSKEEDENGEEN